MADAGDLKADRTLPENAKRHKKGPTVTRETPPKPTVSHPKTAGGSRDATTEVASGDPVEAALADALMKASAAGAWGTVEVLSRELTARREALAGVVELAAERRKRRQP